MATTAPGRVEPSHTRDRTHVPCTGRQVLNHWTTKEVLQCDSDPGYMELGELAQIKDTTPPQKNPSLISDTSCKLSYLQTTYTSDQMATSLGGCSPNPLRLNDLVESLAELKKAPSSRFQVCCKGYRPGAVNGELHQGVGVPEVGCCVLRLPLHPACPQSSNLGGSPEPRCPLGFHYSGQFQGPLAVIGLCL